MTHLKNGVFLISLVGFFLVSILGFQLSLAEPPNSAVFITVESDGVPDVSNINCAVEDLRGNVLGDGVSDEHGRIKVIFPFDRDQNEDDIVQIKCGERGEASQFLVLEEHGPTFVNINFANCLCQKITGKITDPNDFGAEFPPAKFGKDNPKVTITQNKKGITLEITTILEKSITCFTVENTSGKCKGLFQFGGAGSFEIDGEFANPDSVFGLATFDTKGEPKIGLKKGKPIRSVDCTGLCKKDREGNPIETKTVFATHYVAFFKGKTGSLSGDFAITMSAFCGDDLGAHIGTMKLRFDNGKLNEKKSDYDGDGTLNEDDNFDYDPTKT